MQNCAHRSALANEIAFCSTKKYIFLAKRVTPGQLKRSFSTFREENSRPLRGHKEKQPHKHMQLLSLSIWLAKSGQYFDTFFFQHFFIHNAVAAVSRKAVKHIYDYVPEHSAFCIRNHSLKSRASVVRFRASLIRINIYYVDIFAFGKFFTDTNLRLDTLFILTLRTESGIDNSFINSFPSGKIFLFSAKQSIGKRRNGQGISRKYNQ